MKKMIKFGGLAVVVLALAQSVQAAFITGNIGFTGRVTYDTGSAGNATQVATWINPAVNGTSGDFTTIANGTAVSFAAPWSFVSGPVASFWSVGGYTFNLLSSGITSQGGTPGLTGFVVINGTGTVSGNGFQTTALNWSFTSQDPGVTSNPLTFTFSAAGTSVPDGGATAALLGLALSGAALLKRKLMA